MSDPTPLTEEEREVLAEAMRTERERALREALEGLVSINDRQAAIGPASSARGGMQAVANEIKEVANAWKAARAALEPTDPAPSTTEGECGPDHGSESYTNRSGVESCSLCDQPVVPTTEGAGGDESCGSTLEHTIRCTKSSGHEPPHSHVSGEGTAHWADDDPRGRATEGAREGEVNGPLQKLVDYLDGNEYGKDLAARAFHGGVAYALATLNEATDEPN